MQFFKMKFRDFRQRQTGNVPDQQWIDCICLIISKSLKNEIEVLLDKYKTVNIELKIERKQ